MEIEIIEEDQPTQPFYDENITQLDDHLYTIGAHVPREIGTNFIIILATTKIHIFDEALVFIQRECNLRGVVIGTGRFDKVITSGLARLSGSFHLDYITVTSVKSCAYKKVKTGELFHNSKEKQDLKVMVEINVLNIIGLLHIADFDLSTLMQKLKRHELLYPIAYDKILCNCEEAQSKVPSNKFKVKLVVLIHRDINKKQITCSLFTAVREGSVARDIKSTLDGLIGAFEDLLIEIHESTFMVKEKDFKHTGPIRIIGFFTDGKLMVMKTIPDEYSEENDLAVDIKKKFGFSDRMENSYAQSFLSKCNISIISWNTHLGLIHLDELASITGIRAENLITPVSRVIKSRDKTLIYMNNVIS